MKLIRTLLAPVMIALFLSPAGAGEIRGRARVIDGDTIAVGGIKIRFRAIDAPETDQICLDENGKKWTCGITARNALAREIGNRPIFCITSGTDNYKRSLADCSVDGLDVSQWLVLSGLALAYVKYAEDYIKDEKIARSRNVGMWRGSFIAPSNWRHREPGTEVLGAAHVSLKAHPHLSSPEVGGLAPNASCTIKGNVNGKGERIYHLSGMSAYNKTRIDKGQGERWFCNEEEAASAGWRKAMR